MDFDYQPFQPILSDGGLQRFELSLQQRPATEILSGIVHSYLQVDTATPSLYPIIPDATQAVFFSPQGVMIGGAQTKAVDIPMLSAGEYFGIRFYPAALRYFFKLDLADITDDFVDAKFFPCELFSSLQEEIYETQGFFQRTELCERWLLKHYVSSVKSDLIHAIALLYQHSGNIRIAHLSEQVGWSSRHLNRLFRLHTGLSTKEFAQIIRLQQACKQLCYAPSDYVGTAHDVGFYDQSHLNNDYKKRMLSSPSAFFNRFMSDFSNR